MADPMTNERLAEILWDARKRTLGYSTITPLAELPADLQSDYRRFAAEVAKLLDQDCAAEVERLRAQLATVLTNYETVQSRAVRWKAERDDARTEAGQLRDKLAEARMETARRVAPVEMVALQRQRDEVRNAARAEVERLHAELEQAQTTITGLNRKLKVEEFHYRQSQRARREAEAERDGARADRGLLAEQIRRVRAAHPPEDNLGRWTCGTCLGSDEEQMPYPCPTIRALDGEEAGRG